MAKTNKRRSAEYRTAAAKKAAELRQQQQAAQRRRRVLAISVSVVVVVVIAVVATVLVQSNRSPEHVAADEGTSGQANGGAGKGDSGQQGSDKGSGPSSHDARITDDYGFVVGDRSAPAKVVIYEDFQCPICKALEDSYADMLQGYVDKGMIKVEYRPIAILDTSSNHNYSTRSTSAAVCVMKGAGVDAFEKFHDLLYANQPPESGGGLPDSQLVKYAEQAGATGVKDCITSNANSDWAASATEAASKNGVNGTPFVYIDGQRFKDLGNKAHFQQAIEKAAKQKN